MNNSSENKIPAIPFPGINPFGYEYRDIFFARKDETRTLIQQISMYRAVMLYADSGTGKSSLINAGLIPHAIKEGYQPEYIRVQPKKEEEFIVKRISKESENKRDFLPTIFTSNEDQEHVVLSVNNFLENIKNKSKESRPLLIFDQFEEWVTLFEDISEGQAFEELRKIQNDIKDAILSLSMNRKLPVKILIVFREDYLPKLEPFFEAYPDLTEHYLRLSHIKVDEVLEIIRGPFEKYPQAYNREILIEAADKIKKDFEKRSQDGSVQLTEVQIVCRFLFEQAKKSEEIESLFIKYKGVKGILGQYFKGALESLDTVKQEPAVALLGHMITSDGKASKIISRDDLFSLIRNEDKISDTDLLAKTLIDLESESKLVRSEFRGNVLYYTILSDFLASWVRQKDQERKQFKQKAEREAEKRELQEKLEKQRKLAEAESRAKKRYLRYLVITIFATILAIVGAIVAYHQSIEVEYQRKRGIVKKLTNAAKSAEQEEVRSLLTMQAYRFLHESEENEKWFEHFQNEFKKLVHELDTTELQKDIDDRFQELNDTIYQIHNFEHTFAYPQNISDIAVSSDGRWVSMVIEDGTLRTLDIENPSVPPKIWKTESKVFSVTFSNNNMFIGFENGTIGIAHILEDSIELSDKLLGEPGPYAKPVHTLVANHNGTFLASGDSNGKVEIWNLQNLKRQPITLSGHKNAVLSLTFSPDDNLLASEGADHSINVWDLQEEKQPPIPLNGHKGTVLSLAFSPDGKLLASGSADETVILWDYKKQKIITIIRCHVGSVHSLLFRNKFSDAKGSQVPYPYYLVIGSGTDRVSIIRLWDIENLLKNLVSHQVGGQIGCGDVIGKSTSIIRPDQNNKPITIHFGFEPAVLSLMFTNNGKKMISSSADTTIRLWDWEKVMQKFMPQANKSGSTVREKKRQTTEEYVEIFCERVCRNLKQDEWKQFIGKDEPYQPTCSNEPYRLLQAGKILLKNGNEKDALKQFKKAIELDDTLGFKPEEKVEKMKKAFHLINKGKEVLEKGKATIAAKHFDNAKQIDPDLAFEIKKEAYNSIRLAEEMVKEDKLNKAIDILEMARKHIPAITSSDSVARISQSVLNKLPGIMNSDQIEKGLNIAMRMKGLNPAVGTNAHKIIVKAINDHAIKGNIDIAIKLYKRTQRDINKVDRFSIWNNLCIGGSLNSEDDAYKVIDYCDLTKDLYLSTFSPSDKKPIEMKLGIMQNLVVNRAMVEDWGEAIDYLEEFNKEKVVIQDHEKKEFYNNFYERNIVTLIKNQNPFKSKKTREGIRENIIKASGISK